MKAERVLSKHNDYEHLTDWMQDNVRVPFALRIWCSECGTSEVSKLPHGLAYTCQQAMADKLFRNRGWILGRKRKQDICPACARRDREERNNRRAAMNAKTDPTIADIWPTRPTTNVIELKPVAIEDTPLMPTPAKTPAALTIVVEPREMSRADKRIIFNKLEEVYGDEHTGYSSGWSDQKVASDLGVAVDWVRTLRDENFGPEGHSPEAKAVFEETRKLLADMRAEREKLVVKANELTAAASKLALEADRLERKLTQIEKGKL